MAAKRWLFSKALADKIINLTMMGQTLEEMCEKKDMPPFEKVLGWIYNEKHNLVLEEAFEDELENKLIHFRMRYWNALQAYHDTRLNQADQIADDDSNDMVGEDGLEKPNSVAVQRANLQATQRRWRADHELARLNKKVLEYKALIEEAQAKEKTTPPIDFSLYTEEEQIELRRGLELMDRFYQTLEEDD